MRQAYFAKMPVAIIRELSNGYIVSLAGAEFTVMADELTFADMPDGDDTEDGDSTGRP